MKKLSLLLALLGIVFSACEGGLNNENNGGALSTSKIELSQQNIEVGFESNEYEVMITSPYSWEATTKNNEWIEIKTKTGIAGEEVLKFSVNRNEEEEERKGTIVLKNENYDLVTELYVIQKSFIPEFKFDISELTFSYEGGTQEVAITANCDYEVTTDCDWLSAEKCENGVNVTATASNVTEERKGTIVIKNEKYNHVANIEVTQERYSGPQGLIFSADTYEIYDNGEDKVTFTVKYNGQVLTEGYTIYAYQGENLDSIEALAGNTFSATSRGVYRFFAEYGTLQSTHISINVITTPPSAPEAPADTQPSNLNFNRRVLLMQFTGTGCPNCPRMVNALDAVKKDATYGNNVAIASAHIGSYAYNDPAAMQTSLTLDDAFGIVVNPDIVADMVLNTDNPDTRASQVYIGNMVKKSLNRVSTRGGIAVNSKYDAETGYIVLTASVKAAETAEFRIGAILLEDDIYGKQQVNSGIKPNEGVDFNNHENCIRRIAGQNPANASDFSGYDMGIISQGKTKNYSLLLPLSENWNPEKLHILVYVTTKEGENWYVNNVIDAKINGQTGFEYIK